MLDLVEKALICVRPGKEGGIYIWCDMANKKPSETGDAPQRKRLLEGTKKPGQKLCTDGRTDTRTDEAATICYPQNILGEHKKELRTYAQPGKRRIKKAIFVRKHVKDLVQKDIPIFTKKVRDCLNLRRDF
ncbi:hypothetical protein DPMN_108886 [Dreissena polymorpha]|uniref:Uncharacterized protein n=1 Tax=Dreissena polymorpha TaxID=45954 RepID=A0A9D4K9M3_DREPO|nr:hypothetical protein DPMN_108886 [Dreissena polymorpha]